MIPFLVEEKFGCARLKLTRFAENVASVGEAFAELSDRDVCKIELDYFSVVGICLATTLNFLCMSTESS